jgi:hypothetical protein
MNYDEVKASIDATIQNLDPNISTATGTVTNLVVSGCSVPIAGCYGYAERLSNRVFPDLCTYDDLVRHALLKGIPFNSGVDEDVLRDKVLQAYRIPPSGADGRSWQMMLEHELLNVQYGFYSLFDNQNARGIGTVDIVLDYRIDENVLGFVAMRVAEFRPLGLADIHVSRAQVVPVELRLTLRGNVDRIAVQREISAMLGEASDNIRPAAPVFQSRIESVAVRYGAEDAKMSWRYDDGEEGEWINGSILENYYVISPHKIYRQFVVRKDVVFEQAAI